MIKKDVAHRASEPGRAWVTMSDGRTVRNACYDPKRARQVRRGKKLGDVAELEQQLKEETARKTVHYSLNTPDGIEMERDGDSGYIDIGGGEELLVENVYAKNPIVTLNDADGNLTEVSGTVREIASQRRLQRMSDMDIPAIELQNVDCWGDSYDTDEGYTETTYQYDENGDAYPYSDDTRYVENPSITRIPNKEDFVKEVLNWPDDVDIPDDFMYALDDMGFFDPYSWEPRIEGNYYGEEFSGFDFDNVSELLALIKDIGGRK